VRRHRDRLRARVLGNPGQVVDGDGRIVDVVHRDRRRALERAAYGVGDSNADRLAGPRLEVDGAGRPQRRPSIVNAALSSPPVPPTSANASMSAALKSVADRIPTVVPADWFSATLEPDRALAFGGTLPRAGAGGGVGVGVGGAILSEMIPRART
jgi:hypothetical protein